MTDRWLSYLTLREEVNAVVRQTLWEMGAFGDCTAEELSAGWKCPETEEEISFVGISHSCNPSVFTFRTASAVAGRPAAAAAASTAA